jgi:cation transport regulator ChaB
MNRCWPSIYRRVYVPKCFIGDTLQHYRDQERRRREAAEQEAAEAHAWAAEHRREQEQILADPNASEEDKRWAREFLSGEGN